MIDNTIYQESDGRRYMVGPDGRKNYEQGATPRQSLAEIAPAAVVDQAKDVVTSQLPDGGAFSLSGIGSAGNYIAPGLGALGAYDLFTSDKGKAGGALQGAASGAGIGSYFGPQGALIGAGVGGLAGLAKGFFNHKSTKQMEQERWSEASDKFSDKNKATVANLYKSAHAPGDKGEKWTPEVAAAAIKNPTSIWGQQGMLNTFGNDYFDKMDEFQRYAASQAAIDAGLVDNDKGDIIITDPAKLKTLTEAAYKNADYRKAYDAWKKTEKKPALSSIAPTSGDPQVAAANIMAGAQKQIANQSAQQTRQQNLLGIINQAQSNIGQKSQMVDGNWASKIKNPYL